MIHASWRNFYDFNGKPEDIIDGILETVGDQGTVVMPCYGKDKTNFDADNDESAAGVLSETFRRSYDVTRSRGSHFACAAYGPYAETITGEHEESIYGFDEHSPYYKFTQLKNAKIVMLGLGRASVKLSLYHLPELMLKGDSFYQSLFEKTYTSNVIYREGGVKIEKKHDEMLERKATIPNRKNIKTIYRQKFVRMSHIGHLDIVVLEASAALAYILSEAKQGRYMIKNHW